VACLSLKTVSVWLAALACLPFGSIANAGIIDWVTVGDAGNAPDTIGAGYGAVATSYRIMRYEFTNQQYADFLNSVDSSGTNPYSVYNSNMSSNPRGGISFTDSAANGSKYGVKTDMGDKPVNYVSWFDAARVSNWLMNGATSSSSTETGAYTLVGGQTSGNAPWVNSNATFYVPAIDQWYKAAYYKGGGTDAGYWTYATQSNTAPTAVNATVEGSGTSGGVSPVTSGNYANYDYAADWNSQYGNVTTVGTNGGPSAYGTFDMSGNVTEWNDPNGTTDPSRWVRGGRWNYNATSLYPIDGYPDDPSNEGDAIGFRLASPVSSPSGVPEIDPNSLSAVLGLIVGGLGLLERRRYGR
jgi:formylglycine-generating enzyme required for sulfatase activity